MEKKIKDYEEYPKLYAHLLQEQIRNGNNSDPDILIIEAFDWGCASLYVDFYQFLYRGEINKAKKMYSKLFEESNKTAFKKGDYIVIFNGTDNSFKANHVYKLRENRDYLVSELDSKGSTQIGWGYISYNTKDRWRYATSEEIAKYNKLGKPYDVTKKSEEPIKCYSNGKPLVNFEVGKWYTNPKHSNVPMYCRVSAVEVVKMYSYDEYYNRLSFDKVADRDWNIKDVNESQANDAYDRQMVEVTQPFHSIEDNPLKKASYKDIPSDINTDKVDMQSILEEAKRRYPIGTKIKCNFGGFGNDISDVRDELFITDEGITHYGLSWVYLKGKWAEIISTTEEKTDYSNYFVKNEWYVIDTGFKYLIKFNKITYDKLSCIHGYNFVGKKKIHNNNYVCNVFAIKSARKATKEEVEEHFSNEYKQWRDEVPKVEEPEYFPPYGEFMREEQGTFMEPLMIKSKRKKRKIIV